MVDLSILPHLILIALGLLMVCSILFELVTYPTGGELLNLRIDYIDASNVKYIVHATDMDTDTCRLYDAPKVVNQLKDYVGHIVAVNMSKYRCEIIEVIDAEFDLNKLGRI